MEIKRVLLNKKIIVFFLLLIIVNIGFYINTSYRGEQSDITDFSIVNTKRIEVLNVVRKMDIKDALSYINSRVKKFSTVSSLMFYDEEKTNDYQNYVKIWKKQETQLRKKHPNISADYDNQKYNYTQNEIIAYEYVFNEISDNLNYINDYEGYLKKIDEQAVNLNTVSIFADNSSFSSINIFKTAEDYKKLKGIKLTIGNDEPLTGVVNYTFAHYVVLLFSIVIILKFIEERKRGLQNLVFSTPKGRAVLAAKRCIILTITVVATSVIVYGSLFISSFLIYGGTEDLFRNVQSIEMFKNFTFPMSEIKFIVIFVLINILTQLAISFLLLFIFSFIQNNILGIGLLGIISGIEFFLYTLLPIQDKFALLKCVNIFYLINPTDAVIKYTNLNTFFGIIGLSELIIYASVLFLLVFIFLTVLVCSRKYPQKTSNKVAYFILSTLDKIKNFYWKVIERLGVAGIELYKILIVQKGIIVLAVFVLVLMSSVNTNKIVYSGADSIVNRFYEKYSGNVTSQALKYVEQMEAEINAVDEETNKAIKDFQSGKITSNEYDRVMMKSYAYDNERKALETINQRLQYIDSQEKSGNDALLVNPEGYAKLLGSDAFNRQFNFALVGIFCLTVLLSNIFAFERKMVVTDSLKSSYKGRSYLFFKKIYVADIIALIIWAIASVIDIYSVTYQYSLREFGAPVKSLMFMQDIPFNISIGLFLTILYLLRLILLLAVTKIICLISVNTRYEVSIAISFMIIVLPSILYLAGIDIFVYFSFAYPVAMMSLILNSNGFSFLIPILIILSLGLISGFIAKYQWRSVRRKNDFRN